MRLVYDKVFVVAQQLSCFLLENALDHNYSFVAKIVKHFVNSENVMTFLENRLPKAVLPNTDGRAEGR